MLKSLGGIAMSNLHHNKFITDTLLNKVCHSRQALFSIVRPAAHVSNR